MSIVNGHLGRRSDVLASCNLLRNPFVKTEPSDEALDQVFVGREEEILDAAMRVYDGPRNLLVVGGYGYGKTTFVRKLLRELTQAKRVRFVVGYSPLRHDSPEGFQMAALTALVEGALEVAAPGSALHDASMRTREELARLEPEARGVRSPDLRFRDLLKMLRQEGFHRAVVAIDEVDKRDARVVQEVVMGARALLDTDASFVLTGRYMDIFSDIRSSLMAAFDHRIELRPFTQEESRRIFLLNLKAARRQPEDPPSLAPFEEDTVEAILNQAKGLPRPLNLMAYGALEQALREQISASGSVEPGLVRVTTGHLEHALQQEGNLIFNDVGEQARDILKQIFRKKGYVSGADLDALSPTGGLPKAVQELEQLTREDALLRIEVGGSPAFALTPQLETSLRKLEDRRARLQELWDLAKEAATTSRAGSSLENFASVFFEESFKVGERNLRTDTEEIDLVLEVSPETGLVFRKSSYLLVECKNWRSSKVDQSVVTKLAGLLAMRHLSQGFVLTTGEFTADARLQATNAVQAFRVEVVLIDGASIEAFLEDVTPLNDFLMDLHRRQTLRAR